MLALAAAGDDLSREAARRAAQEELAKVRYHDAQPPLLVRLVGRAIREFLALLGRAAGHVPGGRLGLVLVFAVLGLFVAVVFAKLGAPGRARSAPPLFLGDRALTAQEHRRLADEAAGRGEWAAAVRERLRAVVRELEARGVLELRPGRTAGEVARDGGAAVPAIRTDLATAARLFDEIWYGGRTADSTSYTALVEIDRSVTATRLVAT